MAGDLVQSWDEERILNSDSHAQENVWKRSNQVLKLSLTQMIYFATLVVLNFILVSVLAKH